MPRPSRSLFASLPWDLKKTIRAKADDADELVDDVAVKAEMIRNVAEDFLPTQPTSPQSLPADEEEEEAMSFQPAAAPAMTDAVLATPTRSTAKPIPPPIVSAGSTGSRGEVRAASPSSSFLQPARKRKRKSKGANDAYADHPWNCTGLVPRYTEASQVPERIRKCELSPRFISFEVQH